MWTASTLLLVSCLLLGSVSALFEGQVVQLSQELDDFDANPIVAAASPQCSNILFYNKCVAPWQKQINYTTPRMTYEGFVAAMMAYATTGQKYKNLCSMASNFSANVVKYAGPKAACFSQSNLMSILEVNKTEATYFQGLFYGMPAECALTSQINILTNATKFGCVMNVTMPQQQQCVNTTGANFTSPGGFCSTFETPTISCAGQLYQTCGRGVEIAICQLYVAAFKANPVISNMTANCVVNCTQLFPQMTTTMAPHVTTTKGAANFALSSIAFLAGAALLLWRSNN